MQAAASTFVRGSALAFRASGPKQQQQRQQLTVRASQLAEPASLPVKKLSGADAGTASIALRVADEDTAKGLVHRYLVMVRQNARQVRMEPGRGRCRRQQGPTNALQDPCKQLDGEAGEMRGAQAPPPAMRWRRAAAASHRPSPSPCVSHCRATRAP